MCAGRVVPLSVQQGFLDTLGQLLSAVGQRLQPFLPTFLPLLTRLGVACGGLLAHRERVRGRGAW